MMQNNGDMSKFLDPNCDEMLMDCRGPGLMENDCRVPTLEKTSGQTSALKKRKSTKNWMEMDEIKWKRGYLNQFDPGF